MVERSNGLPDMLSHSGVGRVEFKFKEDQSLTDIRNDSIKEIKSKLRRDRADKPLRFGILDGLRRFFGNWCDCKGFR